MSLEANHDLFFTTIIESAKEIILDSKKLINLITNTVDELENEEIANAVSDQSLETETRTVKLVEHVVKFVEKHSTDAGAKVHCEFLLDATKAVKNSILELIRASKDAVYNRYDYLTQQRMRNCCRVVAESLKNVLSAADTLRSVLDAPPSLVNSESGILTPNVSLSNMSDADYSTVFANTEIELTKDAKNAIVSLNRLKQSALLGKNEDEFLANTKEASNMTTELLIAARTYKLKEPADKLKEATVAVISAAKMMFNNPGDEMFQQQLELAISTVAKSIKNVLYAVSHIARNGGIIVAEGELFAQFLLTKIEPPPDPDIDREVAVMDSVVVDPSKSSIKATHGNQTEREREKLIKIMNEKKKEQEEKDKKREAEKRLRTQSISALPSFSPSQPKEKVLSAKEIKEQQKKEKKEAEKRAKLEKELAKLGSKKKPVDIEGNTVSSLRRIESDEVRIDLSENSKLEEGSDRLSQEGAEKILSILQATFSKFKKEWNGQSADKKKKNTETVRDEMKRILADFNVDAKKYYASQYLSLGSSLTSLPTEGQRLKYVDFHLTNVAYQFMKKRQSIRRPENPEEAELSENLIKAGELFAASTVEMVVYTSEAVLNDKQDAKIIADSTKKILEALKKAVELLTLAGKKQKQLLFEPLLNAAGDCVAQSGIRGLLDDNIVQIANGITFGARLVEGSIQQRIYNTSSSVRILCIQLITALFSVAEQHNGSRIHSTLIQLGGLIFSFLEAKDRLLNSFETARYLAARFAKPSLPSQHSLDDEPIDVIDVDDDDTNIWDGPKLVLQRSSDGLLHLKAGTLNQLVEALTNDEIIDNQFMKTFITTYQSFTTPSKLLEKLIQRYDAPPTRVPRDKITSIRQRVSVVIKYWVENQFRDFHESLVNKLFDFYEKKLAVDGHEELAKLLKKELEKRVNERSEKIKFLLTTPPAQIDVLDFGRLSPAHYFMALNDTEIARQLTLIDFSSFVSIEAQELLNQAWNKPELKHRAPNVLAMISRANKVSFWIATLVMVSDNLAERSKVIVKIINIADELRKQNNFHTLMGIVAGLNMSSVARLKKTFEEVPQPVKETFKSLEKLMSPNSSYKNYRTTLNKASLPCLPYIGTYLSDCTFIEDGNPDSTKEGLINFQKRELVYKAISDVARYQQTPYQFPITEPLYTFLVELPGCTDKDLYNLSLQYEPRDVSRKQRSSKNVQ